MQTPPPMGDKIDAWVGGWVGSSEITKNAINLDQIEITQVCLKIYDLWRLPNLWVDVWVGGCMSAWMTEIFEITTNRINLELNEVF